MFLPFGASRARQREAQNARNNRAEIVKALSQGQITKRDLIRWGIFTAGGVLVAQNGLSPFARSAYAAVPTGTPRSPLGTATKFSQPMPRLRLQSPTALTPSSTVIDQHCQAVWTGDYVSEWTGKCYSYHDDYDKEKALLSGLNADPKTNKYMNPSTLRGPIEGRPPGDWYQHQRWAEYFPKMGYCLSLARSVEGTKFHPGMAAQDADSVWCYGHGKVASESRSGMMPPPLFQLRYGEPALTRIYNMLPADRAKNNGFGRNETQLHFHNAHNGAESDGATGAHHFPGTFYDYRWSTTLARADMAAYKGANDPRASGPNDTGGLQKVPGDFREIQGTMWCHDHRFFFTAENVYKGNLAMNNMYSGPDRGFEGGLTDTDANKVNLRLPSGTLNKKQWGNIDFDVNLVVSDGATDPRGQYFFDIFTTDGALGDMPLVNFAYAPFMEVLPRQYRFRILNASMSRFFKLALADASGNAVPFHFIANDGNFVINPIQLLALDEQGIAERYDIVVDFSKIKGSTVRLVNLLQQTDGRKPDGALSMANALRGTSADPVVGPMLEFRIVNSLRSVDDPSVVYTSLQKDLSTPINEFVTLTEQIPIVAPTRTRVVEFGRGNGDSRGVGGQCTPDCSEVVKDFPWIIKVNGQASHSFNSNRISQMLPKAGEVEHWTYVNGGGGWDHPIHLHFEEGITMNRGGASFPKTENLVRKDVWRLRPAGTVQFQIQFGEYGGSYVNHCHNTVHEDFAMLMRIQLLGGDRTTITGTPNPTPDGVFFTTPEVLPEGNPFDPNNAKFFQNGGGGGGGGGGASTAAPTTTAATSGGGGSGHGGGGGSGHGGGGHGG